MINLPDTLFDMATEKPIQQLKQEAKQQDNIREKASPQAPATVTKPVRHYRAYLFQIYIVVAVLGFGALFVFARSVPYFTFDLTIERALQSINSQAFYDLMYFVSGLGFNPLSYLLCGLIIVYIFIIGLRWEAVSALFAAGGVALMGVAIKLFVQRARPTPDLVKVLSPLNDYSFPSGHVLLFTAFLGFLCFLFYTLTPHSWQRTLGIVFTAALIALVGISRIYLGQHWPSDVLGAYLFGSLWLALSIYVYRWGKPRFFVTQPAAPEVPKNPAQVIREVKP